ncbi:rCG56950 [Rattus norvegicus]|uniref:RCG56950 n=1 Tax=Rattus norvegicus TaxID=10116 RepID=A6JD25_RAT|nr:rCG56950 [Rattus norvegicus]
MQGILFLVGTTPRVRCWLFFCCASGVCVCKHVYVHV